MVGAIHGRLLTAWSVAGILGPVLVNYINDAQIKAGVAKSAAYDTTMYVLAALLAGGFLCNLMVRPLAAHWFMSDAELAAERQLAHDLQAAQVSHGATQAASSSTLAVAGLWLVVGLPLAWGIWNTLVKALALFR